MVERSRNHILTSFSFHAKEGKRDTYPLLLRAIMNIIETTLVTCIISNKHINAVEALFKEKGVKKESINPVNTI